MNEKLFLAHAREDLRLCLVCTSYQPDVQDHMAASIKYMLDVVMAMQKVHGKAEFWS